MIWYKLGYFALTYQTRSYLDSQSEENRERKQRIICLFVCLVVYGRNIFHLISIRICIMVVFVLFKMFIHIRRNCANLYDRYVYIYIDIWVILHGVGSYQFHSVNLALLCTVGLLQWFLLGIMPNHEQRYIPHTPIFNGILEWSIESILPLNV